MQEKEDAEDVNHAVMLFEGLHVGSIEFILACLWHTITFNLAWKCAIGVGKFWDLMGIYEGSKELEDIQLIYVYINMYILIHVIYSYAYPCYLKLY